MKQLPDYVLETGPDLGLLPAPQASIQVILLAAGGKRALRVGSNEPGGERGGT